MEERKKIIYTAADLQRYHSGSMSEAEMHALEKAAMNDPFLADALEGYAFTNTAEKDIIELKKRISGKEKNKKVVLLFTKKTAWLSAAAVLAFIFGTIYLTLNLNNNKKETILAKNENIQGEKSLLKTDSTMSFESSPVPATVTADTTRLNVNPGFTQVKPIPTLPQKANSDRYTYSTKPETTADGDGKTDSLDLAAANKATDDKQSSPITETAKSKILRRDVAVDESVLKDKAALEYKNTKNNRFSGKVIDMQGNPVAFASITGTGTINSVTTDASGNFSISAKDSIFPVTIACVGYDKMQKELKNNTDQTIVLSRNTQELTAVVVTALGQVRQKKSLGYSTATVKAKGIAPGASMPVIGTDKFNAYINDSIKRPQTNEGVSYKGDVILSFKIKKNGKPYNVKVEKSLCKPCDEEAKRLLMEGPKWKYINNKRTNVTIGF